MLHQEDHELYADIMEGSQDGSEYRRIVGNCKNEYAYAFNTQKE
jgi:hypothetical protein